MKEQQLPTGWTEAHLEELVTLLRGVSYKKQDARSKPASGRIPILRATNIDGELDFSDLVYVPSANVSRVQLLNVGDIVIAASSGSRHIVGKAAALAMPWVGSFGAFCYALRPHDQKTANYLSLFLQSSRYRRHIFGLSAGVNINNLRREHIERVPIPVAPLNEQRRIVLKIGELFSELDKGVESLKAARAQLRVYRQAVLKHAFEGKLTAQWREENRDKIETADQLISRIPVPVQPIGGRAPSVGVIEGVAAMAVNIPSKKPPTGWSWVPLLRIARQETGHTPSRKHSDYWNGDQYWIGIPDARLHNGREIQDTIQKVTRKGLENSSARTLPAETVCLSRTASVGYVCLMTKPMATSQDFATWTCTQALKPKFLMYALMAEGDEIRRFGKGTTHTTIYFPEIRAMTICLPSLEEQSVIIGAVETKLQHIDALNAEIDGAIARCGTIRQSILKKAFSGGLVDQDPNDEPAATLLRRIKAEKASQKPRAKTRQRKAANA